MAGYEVSSCPPIHCMNAAEHFDRLSDKEKLYAHHASRAAWHGADIILEQVSPESRGIYRFILELHRVCDGNWQQFVDQALITDVDLENLLNYAATFLSNIGNYYGSGDSKFIPALSKKSIRRLASYSAKLDDLLAPILEPLYALPPYGLGYPGRSTVSAYYPGSVPIQVSEISAVSQELQRRSIYPENTRIRKTIEGDQAVYEVLQASVGVGTIEEFMLTGTKERVKVCRGDHAAALRDICHSLNEALRYADNDCHKLYLSQYVKSFESGDLNMYRESLKNWTKHKSPVIEDIFGFVEPYRDPYGIRAEFEGLVAIKDVEATRVVARLVETSDTFIRRLPWCGQDLNNNNGKGPFEKSLFEPPDFTCIQALAYCSTIIFPGINLPNYNDLRQDYGFKNVIITNRMLAESSEDLPCPFVDESELRQYQRHRYAAYYTWVVLHELLGHGTSRLLCETSPGQFNFDVGSPPLSPLTNKPVLSWYKYGQTWTSQFEDLSTTVDECRAELVGAYLMDDKELLALFGYTDESEITAADVTYNLYMQQGTDGLRGLADFNKDSGKWGQAHARAHFAVMKFLLRQGNGCLTIDCDPAAGRLTVRIDRTKMYTDGKAALGQMLLKLHVYRCTADAKACREFYEDLSRVDGEFLRWHEIVCATKQPKWVFAQPNTFLENDHVVLKEYPSTPPGVIQSWAERDVCKN